MTVTSMPAPTRRTTTRVTVLCVFAVSVLVGAGAAVGLWSTPTHDANGGRCASAWHFHPGSSPLVHGGEMSNEQRAQFSDECDADGARPWRAGWVALGIGVTVAAGCGVSLVATRRRETLDSQ